MSPTPLSELFTTFTYKVIESSSNDIIYGVGSSKLKNNKINQHNDEDFVGYRSTEYG